MLRVCFGSFEFPPFAHLLSAAGRFAVIKDHQPSGPQSAQVCTETCVQDSGQKEQQEEPATGDLAARVGNVGIRS